MNNNINFDKYKLNFNLENSFYKILDKNRFNIKISFEDLYNKEIDNFLIKSLKSKSNNNNHINDENFINNDDLYAIDVFTNKSHHITIRVDNEIILYASIIIGNDSYCNFLSKSQFKHPVKGINGEVLELNKVIIHPRLHENNQNIIFEFFILFLCWLSNENNLGFIYSTIDCNEVESFINNYDFLGAVDFSKNKFKLIISNDHQQNELDQQFNKTIYLSPIAFTFTKMFYNWSHLIKIIFNNDKEYFKNYLKNNFKKYYLLNSKL